MAAACLCFLALMALVNGDVRAAVGCVVLAVFAKLILKD